jgi:hypothetical protein
MVLAQIIWEIERLQDSHYIYEILKHKLKSQSQYIGIMIYALEPNKMLVRMR